PPPVKTPSFIVVTAPFQYMLYSRQREQTCQQHCSQMICRNRSHMKHKERKPPDYTMQQRAVSEAGSISRGERKDQHIAPRPLYRWLLVTQTAFPNEPQAFGQRQAAMIPLVDPHHHPIGS